MSVVITIDCIGEFHSFNPLKEIWYTWCWDISDKMTRTYYFRNREKDKFFPIKFCCKLRKK